MRRAAKIFSYTLIISILILFTAVAVLVFGRMDESVEGSGIISPARQLNVAPGIGGIIEDVHVEEGEEVSAGDTLFVIQSDELKFELEESRQAFAEAQARLERAVDEYRNLKTSKSYELGVILADLTEAEKRMDFHGANYERAKRLFEKNLIGEEEFEKEKLDYESSQSYYRILEARSRILNKQYERLIEESRMDLEITRQAYELAVQKLGKTVVTSPITGTILTPRPERLVGTKINEGETALSIGDLSELCFTANIDEKYIPDVRVGQEAKIYLSSFPHRQYKVFLGEVKRISPVPQFSQGLTLFEVILTLREPWVEKSGKRFEVTYGLSGRVEIIVKPDVRLFNAVIDGIAK